MRRLGATEMTESNVCVHRQIPPIRNATDHTNTILSQVSFLMSCYNYHTVRAPVTFETSQLIDYSQHRKCKKCHHSLKTRKLPFTSMMGNTTDTHEAAHTAMALGVENIRVPRARIDVGVERHVVRRPVPPCQRCRLVTARHQPRDLLHDPLGNTL